MAKISLNFSVFAVVPASVREITVNFYAEELFYKLEMVIVLKTYRCHAPDVCRL